MGWLNGLDDAYRRSALGDFCAESAGGAPLREKTPTTEMESQIRRHRQSRNTGVYRRTLSRALPRRAVISIWLL